MSTKFPITLLLMELSEQLKAHDMELDLQWVKRDLNQEADELSNADFKNFDQARRVELDPSAIQWIVLGDLAARSLDLYETIVKAKAERTKSRPAKCEKWRKHEKLEAW
jgi:hypothetical protein